MEETLTKSISLENLSTWQVKKSLYKTYQKENFLSNRLKILELEKKKKVKNIENTLYHHRKQMLLKIDRYRHQHNIIHKNQEDQTMISLSTELNKTLRISRANKLKVTRIKITQNNHKQFGQEKMQHQSYDQILKEEKKQCIQQNISKRNQVKLMELESKARLTQYWDKRLDLFKQQKIKDIQKKLKDQKNKLVKLGKMQKIQKKLIKELKETDGLELQLQMMIQEEKKLGGKDLLSLYG